MRTRQEIEQSTKAYDYLTLETLLDIRDLLAQKTDILPTMLPANDKVSIEREVVKVEKQKRKVKRKYHRKNKKKEGV